ncbi:YdcF family protein [Streptomyces sp. NPDC020800]|uniref:YdcF family protein n=1 Tax=Streptomyces sp. NPDC020800 TaxID=3365092 RepID=UPI00379CE4B6
MISAQAWADARLLWDYHRMHHDPRPCSVAVGLGSHDLGVADVAAALYHQGMAPVIVFTGATSPTTRARMPRGEAVHYRERALQLGVPDAAVLLEPRATNTGENIEFTKAVLAGADIKVSSVLLVSKPYEERRSYAMMRKLWAEVEVVCTSTPMDLEEYADSIGDARMVIDMIVGALQRVLVFPGWDLAIEQDVPDAVEAAYERLCGEGFTGRLLPADVAPRPTGGGLADKGASPGSVA